MRKFVFILSLLAAGPLFAHESEDTLLAAGAIRHAPIGVKGDHLHKAEEWMFSYRYVQMNMKGNLDGSNSRSAAEITGTMMSPGPYMVAPLKMSMEMHMLGAMYAPNNTITFMAMLPFVNKEMDLVTRMGAEFTTKTSGLGDLKVGALLDAFYSADRHHRIHVNLGLSLPTGSIDERDDTPAMAKAKLPYGMQLGSGSYDLLPGLTYQAYSVNYNWGAQVLATIRTDNNDNGYRLANRYEASVWIARSWLSSLSSSLRLSHTSWGNIKGSDPDLNPMMVPTADTSAQGGERTDIAVGVNYLFERGALKGQRLAVEYSAPVYQKLDGPQMEMQNAITLGWQYAF